MHVFSNIIVYIYGKFEPKFGPKIQDMAQPITSLKMTDLQSLV